MTESIEWQGRVGDAWAEEWRRTDRTLAPVNAALLDRVLPFEGRRILDIGCGAGATSLALAAALPDAEITGLDLSEALVAAARARAAGLANLRFVLGDSSSAVPAGAPFDLIVSRHGVMFFADPVAAFAHLRGLMAPGGRLLFSCFRAPSENSWMAAMRPILERYLPEALAAPESAVGPFAFADPARIEAILDGAGFAPPTIAPLDFPFVAGAGADPVADAMGYFARIGPLARMLAGLDEEMRGAALRDVERIATEALIADGVVFRAAAWIVGSRAP